MTYRWCAAALLTALATSTASAGEIPGLPPSLPAPLERDFELSFSNDFLGRGGSVDDFRTQQIIIAAQLTDRWLAVLDHSILTLHDGTGGGRVDQLSASLGYQVNDSVVAGLGIRGTGNFAGERIQNGFHRLIGSELEQLPYVDESATDLTAWFDASHYRPLRERGEPGFLSGWERGIWFRAGSLLTSGGQWDNTASVLAVVSRPSVDLWLGVRSDWRSGYEGYVLRETALAEDDVAVVFGMRYGALVMETVQQFDNDASYGQLRLVSTGRRRAAAADHDSRFGLDVGFTLPDVQMRVAGKYYMRLFGTGSSRWQQSVVLAASFGEPQLKNHRNVFVRSRQLDAGTEFERPWHEGREWLGIYVAGGIGWREETLLQQNETGDTRSENAGKAVLTAGTGMRVDAAGSAETWRLQIQCGVRGTLPFTDATLALGDDTYRVQKAALNLHIGFDLSFN